MSRWKEIDLAYYNAQRRLMTECTTMKFDEVLRDLANHAIEEALAVFLVQHKGHGFKPFSCEREAITDGGSTFRIKIEFEPDPIEALQRAVARN